MDSGRIAAPLRATLLAGIAALVALSPVGAGRPKVFHIAGEVKDAKGKIVASDELTFEASGIRLAIRYLEPADSVAAISSVLGHDVDLFSGHDETTQGYAVFALQIENRGAEDLLFEPGQCRFITDKYDAEFPLDYSSLYGVASRAPGAEVSLEDLKKVIYSEALTVKPGGAVRKLLVFPGPRDQRFKGFEVRIGALHKSASADVDTKFRFRKFPVEP
ncbi:MAG TPA: hypothetical protein VE404_05050 [Verrucomicrobiae bacterium]|nr:hypothetical protein [Verrucomicrobiae bacterium]